MCVIPDKKSTDYSFLATRSGPLAYVEFDQHLFSIEQLCTLLDSVTLELGKEESLLLSRGISLKSVVKLFKNILNDVQTEGNGEIITAYHDNYSKICISILPMGKGLKSMFY